MITELLLILPLYMILFFIWWQFRHLIKIMADVGDILNDNEFFGVDICWPGVDDAPYSLALIPDELKMQKLCEKSVEDDPWSMAYVPDNLKTQEMCKKAVEEDTNMLKYLPDQ